MAGLAWKYPCEYDVIVVGSGIAGLFAAIKAAKFARVCLLTKDALYNTNTWLAQGGIAAALGNDDSVEQHINDTILAGAGLCDAEAVKVMIGEGPYRIRELLELGMDFDRMDGRLAMTREGAHSRNRVIHAGGDATGRLIHEALKNKLLAASTVDLREHTFVTDLVTCEKRVVGVRTLTGETYRAAAVILATGGLGRVYSCTTNPPVATGDGVAMAYRAGATVVDMEFIQFHPTVYQSPKGDIFLISEAVRGAGAVLRNGHGERFMPEYHPMAELGPRDVVARAIMDQMNNDGNGHVYLDVTLRDPVYLRNRFPTIYALLMQHGLDLTRDWVPVIPAAHYAMGGVRTGLDGDTNLDGLYACGEVACNGVHGANRLASNSLLEGLVFAARVVEKIEQNGNNLPHNPHQSCKSEHGEKISLGAPQKRKIHDQLRGIMFSKAGVFRNEDGLFAAQRFLQQHERLLEALPGDQPTWELKNLFAVANLIVNSALVRTESRGSHYRSDFPQPDEAWRLCHLYAAEHSLDRQKV